MNANTSKEPEFRAQSVPVATVWSQNSNQEGTQKYGFGHVVWAKEQRVKFANFWPSKVVDPSSIPAENVDDSSKNKKLKPTIHVVKPFVKDHYEYLKKEADIKPWHCDDKAFEELEFQSRKKDFVTAFNAAKAYLKENPDIDQVMKGIYKKYQPMITENDERNGISLIETSEAKRRSSNRRAKSSFSQRKRNAVNQASNQGKKMAKARSTVGIIGFDSMGKRIHQLCLEAFPEDDIIIYGPENPGELAEDASRRSRVFADFGNFLNRSVTVWSCIESIELLKKILEGFKNYYMGSSDASAPSSSKKIWIDVNPILTDQIFLNANWHRAACCLPSSVLYFAGPEEPIEKVKIILKGLVDNLEDRLYYTGADTMKITDLCGNLHGLEILVAAARKKIIKTLTEGSESQNFDRKKMETEITEMLGRTPDFFSNSKDLLRLVARSYCEKLVEDLSII